MIYSGIDWSGSPGDPDRDGQSPFLVIGRAQINGADVPHLAALLRVIRHAHRLGDNFAFRYSGCSGRVRTTFFQQIAPCRVTVYLTKIDKRVWFRPRRRGRPNEWLDESIAGLVCVCPPSTLTGQVLIIDRPKTENAAVLRTASCIKTAMRGMAIQPFPKIKSCPDDRDQKQIVQVADMFAGAFADQGSGGKYLGPLSKQIVVV